MQRFWVAVHPSKQPIWVQYFCIHESVNPLFLFCFSKNSFLFEVRFPELNCAVPVKLCWRSTPEGGIYLEFWNWTTFHCLFFCLLSKTFFFIYNCRYIILPCATDVGSSGICNLYTLHLMFFCLKLLSYFKYIVQSLFISFMLTICKNYHN